MTGDETQDLERLWRTAQTLGRLRVRRKPLRTPLPPLFALTDPERTPDPLALAARLPRGCRQSFPGFTFFVRM